MRPTKHAIERYIERVKPAMDAVQAREDLDRMIPLGQWIDKPEWINDSYDDPKPDTRYFELCEGVVLAVALDDQITTVLTRGGLSPERRRDQNDYNRRRRAAKKLRNANNRDPRSYQR